MRLVGQHALVTGGGSGIGAAIARALAGEGARVTLLGRRRETLEAVAASLPVPADAGIHEAAGNGSRLSPGHGVVTADVTDADRVAAAFAEARAALGPVSILIANAGAATSAPLADVTQADWRAALAVNLDGVFHCCQAALPDLLAAERARIVAVASTAGLKGYAYTAPYVAAKHGAVGLIRAIAAEHARTGLTANAVCPGFTDTDIVAEAARTIAAKTGKDEEAARAALARFNPQGRLVTPQEVAATVLWLCLPEAQAVNGQAIAVDGGETQ